MKSAWAHLPCCFSKGPLKSYFLDIYPTTFSDSVISEKQKLWGSSIFSKCLKFNLNFKNGAKNSEKFFCFWYNYIWIAIVRLSLLRTGYSSSAASVLTSSPKIWHVNKWEFFEHNFVASDKWEYPSTNNISLPCCLSKGTLKGDFLDIYLTTFSESGISEIRKLFKI